MSSRRGVHRGEEQPSARSGLSVSTLVDAGVALADELGLDALTMRRVADRLGVGTMSLYTYVPGRAELIALMVEQVTGELRTDDSGDATGDAATPDTGTDEPGSDVGWRARLDAIARERWELYQRHPWLLDVPLSRPVIGPNAIDRYEHELAAVDGIGLDELEMNAVVELIGEHVAATARRASEIRRDAEASGLSDDEWWYSILPTLSQVLADRSLPLSARVGEAIGAPHLDRAYVLEFGLARILDGIAALVARRIGSEPPG